MDGTDELERTLVGQGWNGPTLEGAGTGVSPGAGMGAPPLVLEGRRVVGSGGWGLQGRGVFVPEKQNNTNRLHTNQN